MPFNSRALADETLADPDGAEQRLGDLWSDHAQVVLFLRHFG